MRVEEQQELSAVELREQMMPTAAAPELPYRDRAWICNITDLAWPPYYFEYGQFAIKPCPADKRYEMTTITARISVMDHGDKQVTTRPIGALHIAHDLVRILNSNAGMGDPEAGVLPNIGLFVCEKPEPTEEQLAEAEEKLRVFYEHYVATADADWETFRRPAFIPGLARRAARWLKVDKPYNISKGGMIECPMCTTNVSSRAAICPNCKYVLNPEKYAALEGAESSKPAEPVERTDGAQDPLLVNEVATPQEPPKKESKPRSK